MAMWRSLGCGGVTSQRALQSRKSRARKASLQTICKPPSRNPEPRQQLALLSRWAAADRSNQPTGSSWGRWGHVRNRLGWPAGVPGSLVGDRCSFVFMETGSVLVDLFVLFATAKVAGELFEAARQPAVDGEILAGILVGPHVLGWHSAEADVL